MDLGTWKSWVMGFVVIAIIIGISATIITQVQSTQPLNSISYNASASGLIGIDTFADWLPTIAVILAAAVVIGIIVHYFV